MIINKIKAKMVEDCRRKYTISIQIKTSNGKYEASAPAGSSVGRYEVNAFPRGGVQKAIDFVNKKLVNELKNYEINSFEDFKELENLIRKYDNTEKLEIVGGDTIIALEFALLKALSKGRVWRFLNKDAKQIPRPLGNIIGGGKHIKGSKVDIQEFLLISFDAKDFSQARKANEKIHSLAYDKLKELKIGFDGRMTYEGALSPNLNNLEILDILTELVNKIELMNKFRIKYNICCFQLKFEIVILYSFLN